MKATFISFLLCFLATNSYADFELTQDQLNLYNEDLQAVFDKVYPQLEPLILNEIKEALDELIEDEAGGDFEILDYEEPSISGFDSAVGVTVGESNSLTFSLPLEGGWEIKVPKIRVRYTYDGPIDIRSTDDFDLKFSNFKIQFFFGLNVENDGKLNFTTVESPKVSYDFDISGSGFLQKALYDLIEEVVKVFVPFDQNTAHINFIELANHELLPVGGVLNYEVTEFMGELEGIIKRIDDKIIAKNMPNGIVYEVYSNVPSTSTWIEAFSVNGEGSPGDYDSATGDVDGHDQHLSTRDAAIWTGHYLAAMAHRYNVLGDEASKNHVKHVLSGIEKLFLINMNWEEGLLARGAAPLTSTLGQDIKIGETKDVGTPVSDGGRYAGEMTNEAIIEDVAWIGHQGPNGISRDQYSGVLFGLNTVYDLVDDPAIKIRVRTLVELALDYLIKVDWILMDDRMVFDPVEKGTPTFWAGLGYQKITFLTIGKNVTEGNKYEIELNDAYSLLDTAWFSTALSSFNQVDSYYSKNLFYMNMYSYFQIEEDKGRRDLMKKGVLIADYYLSHHNNAFFNLIRYSIRDDDNRELLEQSMELLKLRMEGGHRHIAPNQDLMDDIEYEWVDMPLDSVCMRDGVEEDACTYMPTEPVHPALRVFGEFVWQRNPYMPIDTANGNEQNRVDPKLEQIGGDLSLIYWMLRSEGYADPYPMILPAINMLILN